uniref:PDEase domain-containing protein n=1 Tax=Entomoneis paludosa TaxID=265537 RepID=A0A7S2V7Z9_9STRA
MAAQYKNKSIAEQNSVDLAWQLLMSDEYEELRSCIYCNPSELRRFRQMVVNIVMATDIADKEINGLRKERWNKAFAEQAPGNDIRNAKATIVMEHLIQASDVSHCMQHWHIYRKWNEMFFQECMEAYQSGRSDEDPSKGWYQGEIGFFDFYIIPLAKKLKECGVFGVSSDEYLNYALENRREWEKKGKEIVAANREKIQAALDGSQSISNTEMPIRETPMKKSQEWNAARQQTQAIVPEEDGLDESFRSETLAL